MSAEDILYVVVSVFIVALLTLVAARAFYELDTNVGIQAALGATGDEFVDRGIKTINAFDSLIILLFFFYIIATLILAYISPLHPIFFIGSFLFISI